MIGDIIFNGIRNFGCITLFFRKAIDNEFGSIKREVSTFELPEWSSPSEPTSRTLFGEVARLMDPDLGDQFV